MGGEIELSNCCFLDQIQSLKIIYRLFERVMLINYETKKICIKKYMFYILKR
jgi:hypothetical protein